MPTPSEAEVSTAPLPSFTGVVAAAKSGLRRDVATLVAALDQSELLVPLARDIAGAPLGERRELAGELTVCPHLLPDAQGQLFSALFTHPDPLGPIVSALDWMTDGEALKLCALPARLALEMARDVIDEQRVFGAVIDAGAESELCLTRPEINSILAGRALPLLAYVVQIPAEERDGTLLAQPDAPPDPEFVSIIDSRLEEHPEVVSRHVQQTFNPDRDLEPHWTLTLTVSPEADRALLFRSVTSAVEGHVPPPGYLDVLFEDA